MSDGELPPQDGGQGGGDGAGGQGGGAQAPDWLAGLPEEMRGDATLSRYASIEDLARGHLEARRLASSRLVMPGDDDASWAKFGEALRPAEAKDYDIPIGEGVDPEGPAAKFAEGFRAKAHELGIPPRWAKALAEWNNEFVATDIAARNAASQADLDAFKAQTPDYDAKLEKASGLLKALGWDEAALTELELRNGTSRMMGMIFQLADKFGDAERIDPAGKGPSLAGGDLADAATQLRAFDAANRDKINAGDPAILQQRRQLLDAANLQAANAAGGPKKQA